MRIIAFDPIGSHKENRNQFCPMRLVPDPLGGLYCIDCGLNLPIVSVEVEEVSAKPVKYGCHCELFDDAKPDICVIDTGNLKDCIYAKSDMKKEDCEYWRPVMEKSDDH